jgi:hypothetical protein
MRQESVLLLLMVCFLLLIFLVSIAVGAAAL